MILSVQMRQSGLVGGLFVLLTVITGCNSLEKSEDVTAYRVPIPSTDESSSANEVSPQIDELEAVRAEAELERKKAEALRGELELQRKQLEFERRQRETEEQLRLREEALEREKSEAELRRLTDLEKARTYSAVEFAAFREAVLEASTYWSIGKMLLASTHPTGRYTSTDRPQISLTSKDEKIRVEMSVNWRGGFSDDPYETAYRFEVDKKGLVDLTVERDSAIIKIDPGFLKNAEFQLNRAFGNAN